MESLIATFKTSISLPADLARFLDEEAGIAGHQHRSKIIHQALRLMWALKRKLQSLPAGADSVELEEIAFTLEEIAILFPQWSAGAATGEEAGGCARESDRCSFTAGPAPLTPTPALTHTLPAGGQVGANSLAHTGKQRATVSTATSAANHSHLLESSSERKPQGQSPAVPQCVDPCASPIENRESPIENPPAR